MKMISGEWEQHLLEQKSISFVQLGRTGHPSTADATKCGDLRHRLLITVVAEKLPPRNAACLWLGALLFSYEIRLAHKF
ncbi:hypothetical protein [Siminovitchia sp. 179-K 8D1 HS]|uniref:hypothetical protein n=1 Tax=Siminovitchia sp. 179-K 8D1 HS TaxID=3142385 RepID=UPI0039A2E8A6